ncbi:MAG: head-tail connector protein [Muribaculaceae bacterium]|nr:head-tail connector protein [Muribaculaceae bacterium]
MAVVSLALFKKHVRADDFSDDDEYLQHLIDSAEVAVIAATNRSEQELIDGNGGEFPAPLKHAVMMLAAHWYNQRESVSTAQMHEVPDALQALVKPYRKLGSRASRENEI